MIEKTTAYKIGETLFVDFESAQCAALADLLSECSKKELIGTEADQISILLLENKERVLDVLTMTPNARPKARKVNGGTKTRSHKKKGTLDSPVTAPSESALQPGLPQERP